MPYWTHEQEMALISMVEEGKPIEEICKVFKRSREAVRLKISRLGLAIPETQKDVKPQATTTLKPLEIPSPNSMMSHEQVCMLLNAALNRLREGNLTGLELKRLRTVISASRAYDSVLTNYEKIRDLEQKLQDFGQRLIPLMEHQLMLETDPEKKKHLEQEIELHKKQLGEPEDEREQRLKAWMEPPK